MLVSGCIAFSATLLWLPQEFAPISRRATESIISQGVALRNKALKTTEENQRLEMLCETLSLLGEAVALNPYLPTPLVHWANVRQILGDAHCKQPFTEGGYHEVLQDAMSRDRYHPRVAYASGVIALYGGKRSEGVSWFKKALETGISLKAEETQYLLSVFASAEDLKAIVPGKFPLITSWTNVIKEQGGDEHYNLLRSALGDLQYEAVQESKGLLESHNVAPHRYATWLYGLFGNEAHDEARKASDLALSQVVRGGTQHEFSRYLEMRSREQEASILVAPLRGDTTPEKNPLLHWEREPLVVLDDYSSTVGFVVEDAFSLTSIQLFGQYPSPRIDSSILEVWVSDDNSTYERSSLKESPVEGYILGRQVIILKPERGNAKFYKVHCRSPQKTKHFRGAPERLIRAFGTRLQ